VGHFGTLSKCNRNDLAVCEMKLRGGFAVMDFCYDCYDYLKTLLAAKSLTIQFSSAVGANSMAKFCFGMAVDI
jgi:hypothetical protein